MCEFTRKGCVFECVHSTVIKAQRCIHPTSSTRLHPSMGIDCVGLQNYDNTQVQEGELSRFNHGRSKSGSILGLASLNHDHPYLGFNGSERRTMPSNHPLLNVFLLACSSGMGSIHCLRRTLCWFDDVVFQTQLSWMAIACCWCEAGLACG